jgi:ketosteroid isomerase-like protein
MSASRNAEVMREIFAAIERRDAGRFAELMQPDVELHWPPSLPYGGSTSGPEPDGPNWGRTWGPLQPGPDERRMDPRIVAAGDDEVVVLWHQRGLSRSGERLDSQVLGLYRLRDGRLARAQMFYFDPVAVDAFVAAASRLEAAPEPPPSRITAPAPPRPPR